MSDEEVLAAGGVVWRAAEGGVEVALVHRPRYDDWTHPKGKLEAGESFEEAALREVQEETGVAGTLGTYLGERTYEHRGRPKRVRWWSIAGDGPAPAPNDEIGAVRWLPPSEARALLTYDDDRGLLDRWTATLGEEVGG